MENTVQKDITKPFVPTPKNFTPRASLSNRRTVNDIQLRRDPDAVSDEESDYLRPPRLSNVSLKLIGDRNAVDDDDEELSPVPKLSSPIKDNERTGTILGTPNEVARRAVADKDRRPSFLPDQFDRF